MSDLKKADLVLVAVNSPLLCGIYENFELQKSFSSSAKTSDALLEVFTLVFEHLERLSLQLGAIFYARGPGSFTSLKLTHIFLQTLHLHRSVELYCADSFYFNQKAPIKAFGNKYFIKNASEDILIKESQERIEDRFALPLVLEPKDFGTQNTPLYILPPL
ncbi:hypothetical protein BKH42_07320 [Helicobacter sp. 13S00482-2]|uniref:hypothetical protein n=1 Tax=Helicobacter sp. 13S00482-2 TaxID=1476200 RepID=UPI000BA7AE35|nr:hypothetical protein [Helicobacter sp. 13S00482-2]PAF53200.1 hypothetical protein BKH42_07320 [Helicobacter sp. 13S00482-2]